MTEEPKVPPENTESKSDNWQEVGQQFQALGESLAQAVRSAWEHEETQRRVQEMRAGLEAMANEVGQAINETANSPQGRKVRQEAERTASSVRSATEQTVQEVRPQLINALEQLNSELQRLVDRLNQKAGPSAQSSASQTESAPKNDPDETI